MSKVYSTIMGLVMGDALSITDKWIVQISRKEWIKELCNEFESKFKKI